MYKEINNCKEKRNCMHRDYCGAFVALLRGCVSAYSVWRFLHCALFEEIDVEKNVGRDEESIYEMLVYYFCFVLLLYSWCDSPLFFAFDPVITAVYTHVIQFSPFFLLSDTH